MLAAKRALMVGEVARARAILDALPDSPEAAEQRMWAMVLEDRLDDAAAVLDAARAAFGADSPAIQRATGRLSRARARHPHESSLYARAMATVAALDAEPHPNAWESKEDIVPCERPGAKIVVVNFGLWLTMPAEDRLFASMGMSAVHIPGLQNRFRGDPNSIIERRAELNQDVFEACRQTGASWILSTGCSGQGLGALSFGARRQIDGIVAFSPTSTLDLDILEELADARRDGSIMAPVREKSQRLGEIDALADLLKSPVETTVVYDPAHAYDGIHAVRLANAPCVKLVGVPGDGHLTSQAAVASGRLERLLRDTLKRALKSRLVGRHGLHRDARRRLSGET